MEIVPSRVYIVESSEAKLFDGFVLVVGSLSVAVIWSLVHAERMVKNAIIVKPNLEKFSMLTPLSTQF